MSDTFGKCREKCADMAEKLASALRAAAPRIPEELMRESSYANVMHAKGATPKRRDRVVEAQAAIGRWAIETIGGESGGERERQQHLAQLKEQVVEAAVTWRNVPNLGTAMTLQSEIDAYLAAKEHPDG